MTTEQFEERACAYALSKIFNGTFEEFPTHVVIERRGLVFVFGFANETLGYDMYYGRAAYESGRGPAESDDSHTLDLRAMIAWTSFVLDTVK